MVDHLTRVTADAAAPGAERLAGALAALGFTVRREPRQLLADSSTIGGREAKELLRASGFADREYRIHLEYVRQWGFL
jgi:hypothetical protein